MQVPSEIVKQEILMALMLELKSLLSWMGVVIVLALLAHASLNFPYHSLVDTSQQWFRYARCFCPS